MSPGVLAPLESLRGLVLLDSSVLSSPFTDLCVVLETARDMRDVAGLDVGTLTHLAETIPLGEGRSAEELIGFGWRGVARLLPRRVRWSAARPRLDVLGAVAHRERVPVVTITHAAVAPSLKASVRWVRAPLGADARTLLHGAGGMLEVRQ